MAEFMKNTDAFEYKSQRELKRALFVFSVFKHPFVSYVLQHVLKIALFLKIPVGWAVKKNVYGHFVGGESLEACSGVVERMSEYGVESILDYSVESGHSEKSIEQAKQETIRSIENAAGNENIPFAVFKPSAMTFDWVLRQESRPDLKLETQKFEDRLMALFELASELGVPLLVDAEEVAWQDTIDKVVEKGMRRYNKQEAIVFQTLQMYRIDRPDYLQYLIKDSRTHKYFPGIKLVRGAYMEKERMLAAREGRTSPIHPSKEDTDKAYNEALKVCIDNIDIVSVFNGTHNHESCRLLTEFMQEKQLENTNKKLYFVQLYGMSDDLSFGLAKGSYKVAKYVPYGPVNQVMPYLMRRADENSSVSEQAAREYDMLKQELKRRKNKGYVD